MHTLLLLSSLLIVQPGSAKGTVAVVNTQTNVAQSVFVEASEIIRREFRYVFDFVKSAKDAKNPVLVLTVVDAPGRPAMTAAPDAGTAEINVAALYADLKTDRARAKFLAPRVRKTFMRAFAYAAGAGGSAFPGNIFDVATPRDLDYAAEDLPMDTRNAIERHLTKRGMLPEHTADYETACVEGWAPAPKTDEEKKIWNKVHELPTEPIKILPEQKK